jgi:predicted aldo/keto reductase-like oxidoreductase
MLDAHVRERSASVCRMCGACERACPARVPIRDVLRCITYRDLHGKAAYARAVYREHVGRAAVAACGDCVACARACPHGIDIPGSLHYARRAFV